MITANIGKKFLDAYNEKFKFNFSAKEFFVEKYWRLFYNNEKYMQWITNSAFNPGNHLGDLSSEGRKSKLRNLVNNISQNEFDEKNVIGYSISDITGTTSGQITNLELPIKENEAYLSWIGSGFGIDLNGFSILIPNVKILFDIYEGWNLYRDYLNKFPNLKGNQIDAWNSHWLIHRYNKLTYDADNPSASFNPFDVNKDGKMVIGKLPWSKVLFALAKEYPSLTFTSYVYKLGFNTPNITIGFIVILLPKVKYTTDLYEKIFGTTNKLLAESFFGTEMSFTKACEIGSIGLKAMEPKGFRDCLKKGVIPKYNVKDKEKSINFNTYLIWLLAMLNNEKLWDTSREIAQKLIKYEAGAEKSRMNRKTDVEKLLGSTTSKQFLQNLITLIEEDKEFADFEEIGKLVHLMPNDNFPYFSTLIRFQFALQNKQK
ncbi:MAG: hypothetical protein PHW35_14585 [Lentimicrobiaceae bacterium]|jgi:hypothetical protein|nr:hypothetical protein [Lentimicrobiaceae bacterium]